jgi:hypothetical protein
MLKSWDNYNGINENLQKALSILKKNNVEETNKDFKKHKEVLSRNVGYLGKFTEWLVVQKKINRIFN